MSQLRRKPYYARLALVGIGMYLFILAVIFVATLTFVPSQWAYPCIVAAIVTSVGAAIYLLDPWGLAVGVAGGLVGVLFALEGVRDLASPDSFFDFAYKPVFGAAGAILVLGGCSAGLVQHLRGRTSTRGPSVVSAAVKGLIAVVAGLSLASAVLTIAGRDHVSASEEKGAIVITAKAWKFDTGSFAAQADRTTKVVIKNEDLVIHTFTVDALGIDQRVGPGSEVLIEIPSSPPGVYEFHCRIVGHDAMRGTLTVE